MKKRKKTVRGSRISHSRTSVNGKTTTNPEHIAPSTNGRAKSDTSKSSTKTEKQATRGKKKVRKHREDRKKGHTNKPIFPSIGLPQYTLLDVKDRAELPPIPNTGRPSILVQIVCECPDLYKKFISLIRHGVVGHVAAERLGISEHTFYEWAKIGKQELSKESPPDTFYTRFYTDIRRAVAIKRSECEMEIAITDPKKWLSHGPGRIFGDNWNDKPASLPSPSPDQDLLTENRSRLALQSQPNGQLPDSNSNEETNEILEGEYKIVDESVSMDALEELQRQGIIEVTRSYKSQVNKQEGN